MALSASLSATYESLELPGVLPKYVDHKDVIRHPVTTHIL